MDKLQRNQIAAALSALNATADPLWTVEQDFLCKSFTFKSFNRAFSFMTALALYAEKVDHHPDWCNCFRRVDIRLSTFDVHGLTQQDFDFAQQAEKHAVGQE